MRHHPIKFAAALTVLASTCGLAHATDDRPHALPASMLAAASRHDSAAGFHEALDYLNRPDLRHDAGDDGHGWDGHDKDGHDRGHRHHPCTPE